MPTHHGHERTGRRRRLRFLLPSLAVPAALALLTNPLTAQDTPATAHFEVATAATTLQEDLSLLASGSLLIRITGRLSLGGSANVLLGTRALPGSTPGVDQRLRVAYGGLLTQILLAEGPRRTLWLRMLAGAGNAKVDATVELAQARVRTLLAADNFVVVVPEAGGTMHLTGPLHVGVALGYRFVSGVEDLPGVTPEDLTGPTGRLLLSARIF